MNYKRIFAAGIIALICLAIILLNTPKNNGKLRFVVMAPLSGVAGYLGQEEKQGITLAYEQAPNKEDVDLIFEDTQGNTTYALTIFKRQLALGSRFFYTSSTAQTNALLSDVMSEPQKPFMFTITMMPEQTKNYDLAFRIYPSTMQEVDVYADFIKKKQFKKVGILTLQLAAYAGCASYLQKLLPDVEQANEWYKNEEKDFRIQLQKMKDKGVQALIVNGYVPHIRSIMIQLTELDWDIPVLSSLNSSQLQDMPYPIVKNLLFPQPAFLYNTTPNDEFVTLKRQAKSYETFYAYETMKMFMKAIATAKGKTPQEVGQAFLELAPYEGLTEIITFDENRDALLKLKLSKITPQGHIVPVEE